VPDPRDSDGARRKSRFDLLGTALLLLALAVLAPLAQFYGVVLASPGDDCSTGRPACGRGVDVAADLGLLGPWVWWGLALLASALRLRRGRTAFWVPLVGAVLMVATVPVALWISLSAVP